MTPEQLSQVTSDAKSNLPELTDEDVWGTEYPPNLETLPGVIGLDVPPTARGDKLKKAVADYFSSNQKALQELTKQGKSVVVKHRKLFIGIGAAITITGSLLYLKNRKRSEDDN